MIKNRLSIWKLLIYSNACVYPIMVIEFHNNPVIKFGYHNKMNERMHATLIFFTERLDSNREFYCLKYNPFPLFVMS